MKIFKVTMDDLPGWGLQAISLVDFPAVERNFIHFKDEAPRQVLMSADEEKRIITGVALLADTPIYRRNDELGEYYIVFEADVIRRMVEKYSRDGLLNVITIQHEAETYAVDKCVMVESYFTDKERGITPLEFADVPDGSWIVSFKVTDPELWAKIKESHGEKGGLNGFSVECISGIAEKYSHSCVDGPIDSQDALAEALGMDIKKKIELRASRAEIKDAMYEDKQVEITIGADENVYTGQIKDLGRRNGEDIINFYNVPDDVWMVIGLDEITGIKITALPLAPWNFELPSYNDIINNDEIVVTDSNLARRDNIEAAIEGRYYATIFYDDESGEGCTGARTVQVCAYGYHTDTGNECFRAYQWSGATHTEEPAWKMFLTKRCRSFRLMTEADRWMETPAEDHLDDKDMAPVLAQVEEYV